MDTSPDKHRTAITECWRLLKGYEIIRETVDEKINDYRELIRANANFLPPEERASELLLLDVLKHPTNISEAVKQTLILAFARGQSLTPTQIMEEAQKRGFDFSSYTNPQASIHTILRRMKEANPAQITFDEATGSYSNYDFASDMWAMTDRAFYLRATGQILERMLELDKDRMAAVTGEELKKMLDAATKRKAKE